MDRVLLTGATGFVGGATLAWLLTNTDILVTALVRAETDSEASARVRTSIARFGVTTIPARCRILRGALGALSELEDTTLIINIAGDTSFRPSAGMWATNVDATVAFAEWAQRLPRLRRFLHVGTAWICGGDVRGVVQEDSHPDPSATHLVDYTRSKADAEERLRGIAGLPLVVARPTIVAGDTRFGCAPSSSIFWVFQAIDAIGTLNWSPAGRIDVVPVDWTAATLGALLLRPSLCHTRYNVSCGPESCDWRAIGTAFASTGHGSLQPYSRSDRPVTEWAPEILRRAGDPDRLRPALDLYFRFASCDVVFSNARLLAEGLPPSPRFADWIPRCVASVRGRGLDELARADD